jgi:hypothetical protein
MSATRRSGSSIAGKCPPRSNSVHCTMLLVCSAMCRSGMKFSRGKTARAAFAKILAGRHGGQLDNWIAAVDADDQPDLHSFATGLKGDHAAMRNGLTLPWSSGAVEGNVNRIKMLSGRCTAVPDSICASASCSLPDCEGPRPSRKMESHRVDDPGQAGQAAAAVCQRWSHVLAGRYVVVALTRGIAGRGDEFGHPRPSLQMNPTHPRKAGTPGGWAACRGDRAERRAG